MSFEGAVGHKSYTGLDSEGSTGRRKLSNKVQYNFEVFRQLPIRETKF